MLFDLYCKTNEYVSGKINICITWDVQRKSLYLYILIKIILQNNMFFSTETILARVAGRATNTILSSALSYFPVLNGNKRIL